MFTIRWDGEKKRWEGTCEHCGKESVSADFAYGIDNVQFLETLWIHRETCTGGATVVNQGEKPETPGADEIESSLEQVMTKSMRVTAKTLGWFGQNPRSLEEEKMLRELEKEGEKK